jgi:hypothetical protein
MGPDSQHKSDGRRVGIFWFWGEGRKAARFVAISRSWSGTSVIGGVRKLDLDHESGWTYVQRLNPALKPFGFDHFLRGRLEWQEHTDQWRLHIDQKLRRGAFVVAVSLEWKVPRAQLVVVPAVQYRSAANIGIPALS